jgi:DNA-directed RNA polymerase specialized sigma24 family protein
MDDTLLAGRAARGDLDSFGQLYDRYFPRVFDFSWRVLRDADAAGEVTRLVFSRLRRELGAIARGGDVNAWIFTNAHELAISRAEGGGASAVPVHEEAFGAFEAPDPAAVGDPRVLRGDADLPALVWDAATELKPRDYAALDLHLRQRLDPGAMATVLRTNRAAAAEVVSRMETLAGDVFASYVIARRRAPACAGLQAVLDEQQFPPFTEEVRAAVDAHVASCDGCRAVRAALPPLLDVFAALTPVLPPMALKGDLWREIAAGWATAATIPARRTATGGALPGAGALAADPTLPPTPARPAVAVTGAPPPVLVGGDGAYGGGPPVATGGAFNRGFVLWFGGAAAALLLIAFGFGAILARALDGGSNDRGALTAAEMTATAQRPVTPAGTLTPGVTVPTATANLTPSATATEEPPTPEPTEAPTEGPTEAPPTATVPPRPTNTPQLRTATRPAATAPAPTVTPVPGEPTATPCPLLQTCP